MTRPPSPTARHLYDAIEDSSKTQKEIACEAGFASQNMLSMMKTGESKVPISRIPRLRPLWRSIVYGKTHPRS